MQERLIEFETAKLAKEMGFNEECMFYYDVEFKELTFHVGYEAFRNAEIVNGYGKLKNPMVSAPSQSLLQKWLREVHGIDVFANSVRFTGYIEIAHYTYMVMGNTPFKNCRFDTYEEALEVALVEGLKLIENEN